VKLLVATRSVGKQPEFRRVLGPAGIEVVFPDDVGLYLEPAEALLEMGESFEANARRKAEHFARLSGLPTVADDSGLEVLALGGAPGVRSRRWARRAPTPAGCSSRPSTRGRRRPGSRPVLGTRRAPRIRIL
jgi:XTP/dITP diphosphohydrolase